MPTLGTAADTLSFAPDGGEMGKLIRAFDWSKTPLGAPGRWSSSLRSTLSICLGSRFPIALYWGPSHTLLYNDAWSPILGSKHPWALGRDGRAVWPEIWETIGPLFDQVRAGEPTYLEDSLLAMQRHGYVEECYFNYGFTPVRDERGAVAGVFNAVIETTYRVVSERRTRVLRDLSEQLLGASSAVEVCQRAATALAGAAHDVPFLAIYLVEEKAARSVAVVGLAESSRFAPTLIPLDDASAPWPVAAALAEGRARGIALRDPSALLVPGAPWPEASREAMLVPFGASSGPRGVMIVGASPRRAVDDDYLAFVERAAAHLGAALSSAVALETERTRAERLAALDRAKTLFFSNVSHELRTPLTLMLGPIDDALAAGAPLEGDALVTTHRNTVRLLKLVNSLLDFARLEAGRLTPSYEALDLSELTAAIAGSFEAAVVRAGLALRLDLPALHEPIWVDRAMWEKVVLNLLSNALKFTFEGSISVSLALAGSDVELRVADSGVGIPASQLARIFGRFHRVEGTRARSHEGTGIGLALVRDLVRLHGGDVRVESEEGVGSTFVVVVRRGQGHLPAELRTGPPSVRSPELARAILSEADGWSDDVGSAVGAQAAPGAPLVLVADDNLDMRRYLERMLAPYARIVTAQNGALALGLAQKERPDLILTDIMMPELDGVGLLRALRADPTLRAVPVIMLTARAGEESRIEGLEVGADDYVVKPFATKELVARVRNQLALSALRGQVVRERDHFQNLLRSAPIAINFHRGEDLVFELAHPLSRAALGGRELEGRPVLEAIPEPIGQAYAAALRTVLVTGEPQAGRGAAVTLDRGHGPEQTYWDYTFLPVRGSDGRVEGVMTCTADVTDSVRARVAAEDASRAKDEFLAMLGHELRNPLAPIVTALALIAKESPLGLDRTHAVIERQVAHLSRLVDDLLDVSRITNGKITLASEPLELADVVAAALESSAPLLDQKRHRPVIDVPPGMRVVGDEARLAQVVSNLLQNASKFTEPGGVIEIRAVVESERVALRVRDEGAGIPADMLDRVFDTFVQARQSLARSAGGLGLGLAIVKNIVKLHGGEVHAESAGPGKGSTLTVHLPKDVSVEAVRPEPTPRKEQSVMKRRLMVVDDNVDSAELLAIVLEGEGYDVRTAHDGTSALAIHESFAPSVVILDIGLPDLDGYEVARRIRARGDATELVALSGYGQPQDVATAHEAGFAQHLVKPVEMKRLVSVVRELDVRASAP